MQKDIHEATIIIAQKTKMYEEIAGDLVQANTMIVNFTNRYDSMSNEVLAVTHIVLLHSRARVSDRTVARVDRQKRQTARGTNAKL